MGKKKMKRKIEELEGKVELLKRNQRVQFDRWHAITEDLASFRNDLDVLDSKCANEASWEPRFSVEPSNVTGSPHLYMYVYLTPDRENGRHIIVSDPGEYRQLHGFAVGVYEHYEAAAVWYDEYATLTDALAAVKDEMDGKAHTK